MTPQKKMEILTKQSYMVVKDNDLIQKSRFKLSLEEQKTIAYICSMIRPADEKTKENNGFCLEYNFDIREYCDICGIEYDSGKKYESVKRTLKKLRDRSMWLEIGDEEVLCAWLAKVRTNKRSGNVYVKLDEDLVPFLFDLKERYTQYQLYNVMNMRSAFSIRCYELFKSHQFKGRFVADLDNLKRFLMVDDKKMYNNFKEFRKYILEVALREINELTDITVEYNAIKTGRKVTGLEFLIKEKGYYLRDL